MNDMQYKSDLHARVSKIISKAETSTDMKVWIPLSTIVTDGRRPYSASPSVIQFIDDKMVGGNFLQV